ncbi:hypothetical protein HQ545_03395 [Candidatus Woesearchaeota archaeon]|nr:hypothetical protein [Candidatus Woesearchaeota archaeon]
MSILNDVGMLTNYQARECMRSGRYRLHHESTAYCELSHPDKKVYCPLQHSLFPNIQSALSLCLVDDYVGELSRKKG